MPKRNSEVFNSEFCVFSIVKNGKLGVGKARSLSKCLRESSEVFNSEFTVLGIVQNEKPEVDNRGKLILRGF